MRSFAIIPAAGRSRRMGRPKLLLPWGDTTLLQHLIRTWRASRVDEVIVVLHPDDAELAAECEEACAVRYEPPPAEMKDSLRYGLKTAADVYRAGPEDVWLVAPADMPALQPQHIDSVIAAYERGTTCLSTPRIWSASHGGRKGHPVLFPWPLAEEVAKLGADESLKTLFERYPVEYVEVGSAGIFVDVDTPEDYERQRPR